MDFLSDIDDVNSARSSPFSVTQTGSFYVKHESRFVAVSVHELKRVAERIALPNEIQLCVFWEGSYLQNKIQNVVAIKVRIDQT